jgi:hypothetical protein
LKGRRIAAAGNFTIAGSTTLWTINVNTGAPSATLSVYDGTSTSGVLLAVVDASTKSSHAYGIKSSNGLHVVLASGNADVTIGYD